MSSDDWVKKQEAQMGDLFDGGDDGKKLSAQSKVFVCVCVEGVQAHSQRQNK